MAKNLPPIHPGEILNEDFLKPMGITPTSLANETNLDKRHIDWIIQGKENINVNTALRLARYFKTSIQFWLNAQESYNKVKNHEQS